MEESKSGAVGVEGARAAFSAHCFPKKTESELRERAKARAEDTQWWDTRDALLDALIAAAKEEGRREGLEEASSRFCVEGDLFVGNASRGVRFTRLQCDVIVDLIEGLASKPSGGAPR